MGAERADALDAIAEGADSVGMENDLRLRRCDVARRGPDAVHAGRAGLLQRRGEEKRGRPRPRLQMSVEPIADGVERLTVHFPRFAMDPTAEPPAAAVSGSAAEMAALREVLRGSRITVAIQTESPLLRTNSPHREDNRVTLFDADLETGALQQAVSMLASTPSVVRGVPVGAERPPRRHARAGPRRDARVSGPRRVTTGRPMTRRPPETEIFLAMPVGGRTGSSSSARRSTSPTVRDTTTSRRSRRTGARSCSRRGVSSRRRLRRLHRVWPCVTARPTFIATTSPERRISRVTQTPESEYSPTVMADGAHISVVRVEADGTQRCGA